MPLWTALGVPNSDRPHALVSETGKRFDAPRAPHENPPDLAREIPIDRFPCDLERDAIQHFLGLVRDGVKKAPQLFHSITKGALWRHRGGPHYTGRQGIRLKVPQVTIDRSRGNPELHRLSTMLGNLTDRYVQSRKEDNVAVLTGPDRMAVSASLVDAAKDRSRLHVLAAASDDMIDEAYHAFGIEPPTKEFFVACVYDEPSRLIPEPVVSELQSEQNGLTAEPPKSPEPADDPKPDQPKHSPRPKHPVGAK